MTINSKNEVYLHPEVDVMTLCAAPLCTSDSEVNAGLLEEEEFSRL